MMESKKTLDDIKKAPIEEQEKIIAKIGEDAAFYEMNMRGCCQSIIAAFQDNLEFGTNEIFKAVSALSAGVAGNGEVCGALIAGVLLIGLAYGREDKTQMTRRSKPYQSARARAGRLTDKFNNEFGSLRCNDILTKLHNYSFDLRDPEDYKKLGNPAIHDKCAYITCKRAAIMTIETLLEPDPSIGEMMENKT